jgi:hypothetical protein
VSAGNDFDDFDAEKLLAQATAPAPASAAPEDNDEDDDETDEIKRARKIVQVLS